MLMDCRATALCALMVVTSFNIHAQGWTRLATTHDPSPRRNAAAIFDPQGNRMIVFGGADTAGVLNDVWSLNLATLTWSHIMPASGPVPPARFSHNALYDSAAHCMLIWSGQGSGLFNDVWAFDLNTYAWRELWPNGNTTGAPLIRYGTAAVFDPLHRRVVNFAGFTSSGRFEDTWAFQVDSLRWTDRTHTPHPPRRCLHSACFSPERRQMIVYGGQQSGPLDDLWTLDLNTFTWTEVHTLLRPPARYFTSSIAEREGNIVIFGGQTSGGAANDMWKFSFADSSWSIVQQGWDVPPARFGHTMVYLPDRHAIILFGGSGATLFNDSWEFTFPTTDVEEEALSPADVFLEQNYPNPFNGSTLIRFQLRDGPRFVSLNVYDVVGKEVASLVHHRVPAGVHTVRFDAPTLPSGVYFARLTAGGAPLTRKMMILR